MYISCNFCILDEISKQFANSKPKLVFTLNGLFNTVQESLKKIGSTEVLIVITKQQVKLDIQLVKIRM